MNELRNLFFPSKTADAIKSGMNNQLDLEKKNRSYSRSLMFVFLPLLVLLLSIIFWDAITGISEQRSLWSMDGSPLYPDDYGAETMRLLTGHNWRQVMLGTPGVNRVFHPEHLLRFMFPPLILHIMAWIGSFLLIIFATLYFMYSHGIKGLRAALPALALGFSGYTFTLLSAGHRGTPLTIGYAVLVMGLIRNGIRRGTIVHFILAAIAAVYGVRNQMDVMGFFLILIAAYGLLQFVLAWPLYRQRKEICEGNAGDRPDESVSFMRRLFCKPGVRSYSFVKLGTALLVSAAVFCIIGFTFYRELSGGIIERREGRIDQSGGSRWEYITNWSLPPEQVLEFVAPSVYGNESASSDKPYWGRLGQSASWAENQKGFPNFRQHNLYVGGIQIVLAFYALMLLFRRGERAIPGERRLEIGFWWGVTILTLLLAFGRYFPLYRLIYYIPMLNKIRCPVKWFHLTEVSIVFLMGFGLQGLWQDLKIGNVKLPRRFFWGTAITAGALLILAGIAQSTGFGLHTYWSTYGLASVTPKLRNAMSSAFTHGACVFAAVAFILWILLRRHQSSYYRHGALALLLAVLAVDLAVANKPFIHVRDVSSFYASNPIADIVLSHESPTRLADYISTRGKHDRLWRNFTMKGVDMLMPAAYETPSPGLRALFKTFDKNPLRLWQITSTRFIMGGREQFVRLIEHPDIRLRASFYITSDHRIVIDQTGQAPFVLLEYRKAFPRVQLYHSWELVSDEAAALKRLADPRHDPTKTLLVIGDALHVSQSRMPAEPLPLKSYSVDRYEVELKDSTSGIILFNDHFDLNRKPSAGTPVICNAGMQGVVVNGATGTVVSAYKYGLTDKFLMIHLLILFGTLIYLGASKFYSRSC